MLTKTLVDLYHYTNLDDASQDRAALEEAGFHPVLADEKTPFEPGGADVFAMLLPEDEAEEALELLESIENYGMSRT